MKYAMLKEVRSMYVSKHSIISLDVGQSTCEDVSDEQNKSEEKYAKAVCYELTEKLSKLGYIIKDCTPWDKTFNTGGESLRYRVSNINLSNSVLHLSIHFNCGKGRVIECWVGKLGGRAENFAQQICSEISKLGYYNKNVKFEELYILKYTRMPSILIECTMENLQDDPQKQDVSQIADAIIQAVTKCKVNPS
ncbi:N-acetylmuramoyl-L-alanine amidase [Inconstantimicrobium mannanitabidum]|uniref:Uncharacterized protein n=1 Tax=Inconstantimicrobium mannanitabidum TaxID=1604901 RepID=A0ACB5RD19_9CLOT|nr:N-acetylmuramoyl-L-alanine amidase [Clostridium sp. TW13]GKX66986.1 hypothetical protein rsdtw13_22440 [Clostridium sp. TW13]